MNKPEKNFDTGLRVLEVLKVLLNENLKKMVMIEQLKSDNKIAHVYTQEAFIKYFNTLEAVGFKIDRESGRYILQNAILQIELTDEEKELLVKIIEYYRMLHNKCNEKILKTALTRINKYFNPPFTFEELNELFEKEVKISEHDVFEKLILTINNMIEDDQLVKICYKKNKNQTGELTVELKEIVEKNNGLAVKCYIPSAGRNKNIPLENIISINQLPNKVKGNTCLNSVIFELYGRLMSAYKPKQSERVINFSTDHITVSNCAEDKDSLLRRLLKYGENCKIIMPKALREEFYALTENILKNLEEE